MIPKAKTRKTQSQKVPRVNCAGVGKDGLQYSNPLDSMWLTDNIICLSTDTDPISTDVGSYKLS